ncbi:hypothetical protein L914_16812 [Phytophthora nicotianae]|uniref:Uncharacterized protein n=1 Tax=Phytophthora nicotianae TaxID=4792 RepID=W2MLH6_PHYNI|nr:hypothetical protein L914_16812 [Phytophthora nicotianae]
MPDLALMIDQLSMYHQTLRKEDGSLPEIGAEPTQTSNMRTVLVDKGYQGAG